MFKTLYRDNLFLDFLLDLVYFPIWWYTFGLKLVLLFALNFIKHREQGLGFTVWLANILTPMYGQTDFASRLISFVVRLVQVIVRGAIMAVWLFLAILLIMGWLILPYLTVRGIILNLYGQG